MVVNTATGRHSRWVLVLLGIDVFLVRFFGAFFFGAECGFWCGVR